MIRTLIIDDEILIRSIIKGILIKSCPEIEIVGEAGDLNDAVHRHINQP